MFPKYETITVQSLRAKESAGEESAGEGRFIMIMEMMNIHHSQYHGIVITLMNPTSIIRHCYAAEN